MADYRFIFTRIWEDEWFETLDSDGKVLWLYLLTNHRASVAGIYNLPCNKVPVETGLPRTRIDELLHAFEHPEPPYKPKVCYEDGVIWVVNMRDYQNVQSPSIQKCIARDLAQVRDGRVKREYMARYHDSVHTVSTPCRDGMDTVSTPCRDGMDTVSTPCRDGMDTVSTPCRDGMDTVSTPCRDGMDTVSTCACARKQTIGNDTIGNESTPRARASAAHAACCSALLLLFLSLSGKQKGSKADTAAAVEIEARPDYDEQIACAAMRLCHRQAVKRDPAFRPTSLKYYVPAITTALETGSIPGQGRARNGKNGKVEEFKAAGLTSVLYKERTFWLDDQAYELFHSLPPHLVKILMTEYEEKHPDRVIGSERRSEWLTGSRPTT